MTLAEAKAWAGTVMRQRYEWIHMLFGSKKSEPQRDTAEHPGCRHPIVCGMCKKECAERVSEYRG